MRIKVLQRGGQGWPMAQIEATRSGSSRAQGRYREKPTRTMIEGSTDKRSESSHVCITEITLSVCEGANVSNNNDWLFQVTKPIFRHVAAKTHLDSLFLVFVLILHEFQSATATNSDRKTCHLKPIYFYINNPVAVLWQGQTAIAVRENLIRAGSVFRPNSISKCCSS